MPYHLMQWIVDLEDLIIQFSISVQYLESQTKQNRNCMNHTHLGLSIYTMTAFQLFQFEWIVIVVDSSIQTHQHNH